MTALLATICSGDAHADCVTAVYVFGSYARGALTVGDVDIDVEYDARLDPGVEREMLDNLVIGRDWNTPFREALKPARALQVMFGRHEMLVEPVVVYERGDTIDDALARVQAISRRIRLIDAGGGPTHAAVKAPQFRGDPLGAGGVTEDRRQKAMRGRPVCN
jgi:predicted nucleotidyltransferase